MRRRWRTIRGPTQSPVQCELRVQIREHETRVDAGEHPGFTFTDGISLFISCEGQSEVDYYWDALLANGGETQACGWLKDQFGVRWQVIPTRLGELMGDPDPAKSGRVMQAMLGMIKIDVAGLEKAHRGE